MLPWVSVAALLALFGLATSAVHVGPITRGVATTIATLVLLVSLEAADGGLGRRLLSMRPIVYLGRISYGTYLWHWLVILVLIDAYHPSPLVTFVVAASIASAIASLSYQLLEMPIRTAACSTAGAEPSSPSDSSRACSWRPWWHRPRCATTRDVPLRPERTPTAGHPTMRTGKPRTATSANYRDLNGRACASLTFFKPCPITKGNHGSIALVGDSHAGMLVPMFQDLARQRDLSLTVVPLLACPWTEG